MLVNDDFNTGFNYEPSRAEHIVHGIRADMNKDIAEQKENAFNEICTRFNDLYEKSYDKENYSDCREILKEMAKLFGITNNNKVEVTKDQIKIEFA